jgi:hypothetical protein
MPLASMVRRFILEKSSYSLSRVLKGQAVFSNQLNGEFLVFKPHNVA